MNTRNPTRTWLTAAAVAAIVIASLSLIIDTADRLIAVGDHPHAIALTVNR